MLKAGTAILVVASSPSNATTPRWAGTPPPQPLQQQPRSPAPPLKQWVVEPACVVADCWHPSRWVKVMRYREEERPRSPVLPVEGLVVLKGEDSRPGSTWVSTDVVDDSPVQCIVALLPARLSTTGMGSRRGSSRFVTTGSGTGSTVPSKLVLHQAEEALRQSLMTGESCHWRHARPFHFYSRYCWSSAKAHHYLMSPDSAMRREISSGLGRPDPNTSVSPCETLFRRWPSMASMTSPSPKEDEERVADLQQLSMQQHQQHRVLAAEEMPLPPLCPPTSCNQSILVAQMDVLKQALASFEESCKQGTLPAGASPSRIRKYYNEQIDLLEAFAEISEFQHRERFDIIENAVEYGLEGSSDIGDDDGDEDDEDHDRGGRELNGTEPIAAPVVVLVPGTTSPKKECTVVEVEMLSREGTSTEPFSHPHHTVQQRHHLERMASVSSLPDRSDSSVVINVKEPPQSVVKKKPEGNTSEADIAFHTKVAVRLSLGVNIILLALKLVAFVRSGSLTVLASTIDSFLDLFSGFILLVTNYLVEKRDLDRYPLGKKNFEPLGTLVFSCCMLVAASQLLQESITKMVDISSLDLRIDYWTIGTLIFVVVAKLCLFFVCRYLGSACSCRALSADHRNDVVSNTLGVGALVLAKYAWTYADPLVALLVTLWIMFGWGKTSYEQIVSLNGKTASRKDLNILTFVAAHHHPAILAVDTVRSVTTGGGYLCELDIVLPPEMLLRDAHDIGESLQLFLEKCPLLEVSRAYVHIDYETEHSPWQHR